MILADSSLWVDHLRRGHAALKEALQDGQVLAHPFVIGELSCGNLRHRSEILGFLNLMPAATVAEHDEVLRLVESRALFGKGIGWIDAHLLASALLSGAMLWTLDKRLHQVAARLNLAYGERA